MVYPCPRTRSCFERSRRRGRRDKCRPRTVGAESPFDTVKGTIEHFGGVFYGLPAFPFVQISMWITAWRLGISYGDKNPVNEIGKIAPRPVFIIYGDRDRRMPMSDFKALW